MSRDEFAGIVAYLSAAVGKPMSREQAEVYYDLLGDLPPEALKLAARRALLESRYPTIPPVGTLRALAVEASRGDGDGLPDWPEAWRLACRAVGRYGLAKREQALASLPGAVARAADAVGWAALCDATEGDLDTLRAQFRDAYGLGRDREQRERLLPAPLREEVKRLAAGVGLLPPSQGRNER